MGCGLLRWLLRAIKNIKDGLCLMHCRASPHQSPFNYFGAMPRKFHRTVARGLALGATIQEKGWDGEEMLYIRGFSLRRTLALQEGKCLLSISNKASLGRTQCTVLPQMWLFNVEENKKMSGVFLARNFHIFS